MTEHNIPHTTAFGRFFYACILALSCLSVSAAEHHLILNGKSWHLDSQRPLNEANLGFGYQIEDANGWLLTGSVFTDSVKAPSGYLGGGKFYRVFVGKTHADLGAMAFAMKREDMHGGKPFLGALPFVSIGGQRLAVNLAYVPAFGENTVTTIFMQLKIKMGGTCTKK